MRLISVHTLLLTLAVVCAVVSAGLTFGWGFSIFDNPEWRRHATAWLGWSLAAGWASFHPFATSLNNTLHRRNP